MTGRGRLPRPLVVGGRSAGARVACRTAGPLEADAGLLLSFPLHLPGQPEKLRAHELALAPRPLVGRAGHQRHVRHARTRCARTCRRARRSSRCPARTASRKGSRSALTEALDDDRGNAPRLGVVARSMVTCPTREPESVTTVPAERGLLPQPTGLGWEAMAKDKKTDPSAALRLADPSTDTTARRQPAGPRRPGARPRRRRARRRDRRRRERERARASSALRARGDAAARPALQRRPAHDAQPERRRGPRPGDVRQGVRRLPPVQAGHQPQGVDVPHPHQHLHQQLPQEAAPAARVRLGRDRGLPAGAGRVAHVGRACAPPRRRRSTTSPTATSSAPCRRSPRSSASRSTSPTSRATPTRRSPRSWTRPSAPS